MLQELEDGVKHLLVPVDTGKREVLLDTWLARSQLIQVSVFIALVQWCSQDFEGGDAKRFAHEACAQNFSHAPKMLTTPLIKCVLEGSWPTKKAVLG